MDYLEKIRAAFALSIADARAKATNDSREIVSRSRFGALPFRLGMSMDAVLVPVIETANRAPEGVPETRAAGAPMGATEEDEENSPTQMRKITGTCSSTSIDWYGTEMSLACLEDMAAQMTRGVVILPRHASWIDTVEWDEVMGLSSGATCKRAPVEKPADDAEAQFVLDVEFSVDMRDEKSELLVRKLSTAMADCCIPIGMSIGGWFLEVRYIFGEEDGDGFRMLERIIIEKVALDHVAVVRNPANPDCHNLQLLGEGRSKGNAAANRSVAGPVIPPSEPVAQGEPIASPARPEGEPIARSAGGSEPYPSEVQAPVIIDAEHSTGKDIGEGATQARAAEDTMTPEQYAAMMEMLTGQKAAVEALSQKVEAIDARAKAPAPVLEARAAAPAVATPDPRDAELANLRSQVQAFGAVQDALIGGSGRRSGGGLMPSFGGVGGTSQMERQVRGMIGAVREKSPTSFIARAVENAIPVLVADTRSKGDGIRHARANAAEALRGICRAAEEDGVIGNIAIGWS